MAYNEYNSISSKIDYPANYPLLNFLNICYKLNYSYIIY